LSLEASFAALNAELSGTRAWMREVSDQQREDHDNIIRLQGDVKQHGRDIKSLRDEVAGGLRAIRADLVEYKREQQEKEDARATEGRTRNWALIMAVVGPLISAIIAAVVTAVLTKGG
jgi:hypothetical protein